MSEDPKTSYNDGLNDAWAATALVAIVVGAAVFWLSGMPG